MLQEVACHVGLKQKMIQISKIVKIVKFSINLRSMFGVPKQITQKLVI